MNVSITSITTTTTHQAKSWLQAGMTPNVGPFQPIKSILKQSHSNGRHYC